MSDNDQPGPGASVMHHILLAARPAHQPIFPGDAGLWTRSRCAAYAEAAADDLLIRLEPGELRARDFADQLS